MNFDRVLVTYPDGRLAELDPEDFYAIPLGERINLLTGKRLKFEKDQKQISPFDALKKS